MKTLTRLLKTPNDPILTALRLTLGVIFFAHGAQMTLGLFGGVGFAGTIAFFRSHLDIPLPFAFLAIMAQFLGGIALIFGVASRVAATGIAVCMVVAALTHLQNGLFMNWFGHQKGEGIEYHLLAIATALPIIVGGAGALSLDRLLLIELSPRDHDVRPHAIHSVN